MLRLTRLKLFYFFPEIEQTETWEGRGGGGRLNEFLSGFWSTSSKTLSVRSRSELEMSSLQPISGDTGDNSVMSTSLPESSGFWSVGERLDSGIMGTILPESLGFHS